MTFVEGLPKAELHVHHVGSTSIATVADEATKSRILDEIDAYSSAEG